MPLLHAQPYDLSATGFYFESLGEYADKAARDRNAYGDPVEEYEIQFIDGYELDCELAKAWGINQVNAGPYFAAFESRDEHDKLVFVLAVGEAGYSFDPDAVTPSDFDVDFYHVESLRELAEQFIDDGLFGDIPTHLICYIDMDAIARDLGHDYAEATIAGERLVYRIG